MTAPEPTGITDRTVKLWTAGQQQPRATWVRTNWGEERSEFGELVDTVEGSRRPFVVRFVDGSTYPFATIHAVDDATIELLEQRAALLHFVRNMTDAVEAPAALERCRQALRMDL